MGIASFASFGEHALDGLQYEWFVAHPVPCIPNELDGFRKHKTLEFVWHERLIMVQHNTLAAAQRIKLVLGHTWLPLLKNWRNP